MIIEFNQDNWDRAGAVVKVNKFLEALGCDPNYPVSLENILYNKGFDTYMCDDANLVAKLTYVGDDKAVVFNRRVLKDNVKKAEVIAFILSYINFQENRVRQSLLKPTQEVLDGASFVYEQTIDFKKIDEYTKLSTPEERIAFRKAYMERKVKEFLKKENVEEYMDLKLQIPNEYKRQVYKNCGKLGREIMFFAEELFSRDSNVRVVRSREF